MAIVKRNKSHLNFSYTYAEYQQFDHSISVEDEWDELSPAEEDAIQASFLRTYETEYSLRDWAY